MRPPGCCEHSEAAETEARRRARGASRGGVPRGTSSSGATRLRVGARGSAVAAITTLRSRHYGEAPLLAVAVVPALAPVDAADVVPVVVVLVVAAAAEPPLVSGIGTR